MFGEPDPGVSVDSASNSYLAWLEGRTLVCGRYELLRYVGSGSVGSVFVARHIGFDETVVLKFLQPRHLASPDATQHFMREARAGFKLRSEHIARIYDVDVHEEVPFIATEMIEGQTLRAVLEQYGALGRATSVDYALQVCEGLAAAHALGNMHLDIKPENIFHAGDEHIKLVDFDVWQLTAANASSAWLRYVAPARIRAGAPADPRSDIWSLACVLYELLSGHPAFERGSLLATCAAVLEEEPVALPTLPDGLWSVIARCLEKAPDERFADVAELASALEPFGTGRYSHYPERCRALLQPVRALEDPQPTAAVVNVQPTIVLAEDARAEPEPLTAAPKPASRMATLAFDVSAFASPEEAVRELETQSPPKSVPIEYEEPQLYTRPSSPGRLLMLMGTILCLAWGGFALFSGPDKQPEIPKLMHLVTPLEK
jgi:serine/threonine-protein kinase